MRFDLSRRARFPQGPSPTPIPPEAVDDFEKLILRVAAQGNRKGLLEQFKRHFCSAVGSAYYPSSSESWAQSDLRTYMFEAASTPELFIEAMYDGCSDLSPESGYVGPSVDLLNEILRKHGVPFEIRSSDLISTHAGPPVSLPEPPGSLDLGAAEIVRKSLRRAEELLAESRPREAVQEMLWVLESIATAFRGVALPGGTVQGRYFNQIAGELRRSAKGTTLDRVVDWTTNLHGFLSSPTGGGVRHGLDLNWGTEMSREEGRLFCNLSLSYVTYLLAEHEKLHRVGA